LPDRYLGGGRAYRLQSSLRGLGQRENRRTYIGDAGGGGFLFAGDGGEGRPVKRTNNDYVGRSTHASTLEGGAVVRT